MTFGQIFASRLSAIAAESGLGVASTRVVLLLPFAIVALFTIFLAVPATRFFTRDLLRENHPVEMLTFVFFLVAAYFSILVAARLQRSGSQLIVRLFYFAAAALLFVIAMEEIAWGQQFFAMTTPDSWKAVNAQNELTLHNINAMQDHLELLPLSFGLLGMVGIFLHRSEFFRPLMPSAIMLPWFVVIAGISAIDLFQDYVILSENFDKLINALDEVIEMLIALSAILFTWLKMRSLAAAISSPGPAPVSKA